MPNLNAGSLIYQDDFSGSGANPLNGTTPDVSPGGETWVSSTLFNADGTKPANGTGGAFLPFSPVPGNVYRISADLNPDISASTDWFNIGFAQGNNTAAAFYNAGNDAVAWTLVRENDAGGVFQTFRGPVTAFAQSHDPGPDIIGPVHVSIELDTRQANWSAEWFINGQLIRNNLNTFTTNPNITHVGFGALNQANGSFDNFMVANLSKPVPEPSTAMTLLFCAAALTLRRRLSREVRSRR